MIEIIVTSENLLPKDIELKNRHYLKHNFSILVTRDIDVVCVVEEHCCVSGEAGEEAGDGEEIWLEEVFWLGWRPSWTSFPASVIPRFLPDINFPPPILRTSGW